MSVKRTFKASVDSIEKDGDRLFVRFEQVVGSYSLDMANEELVQTLHAAHPRGQLLEVVIDTESLEILDLLAR